MALPDSYYTTLCAQYQERRDFLVPALRDAGFEPITPGGAYYVMCDITSFGFESDVVFARYLVEEIGLAAVPGSSFYDHPASGRHLLRFAFPKRRETLERARALLASVRERAAVAR
jgi:aminotransferase